MIPLISSLLFYYIIIMFEHSYTNSINSMLFDIAHLLCDVFYNVVKEIFVEFTLNFTYRRKLMDRRISLDEFHWLIPDLLLASSRKQS